MRLLCLTDASDRPESELFLGLQTAGIDVSVMCNPKGKHYERLKEAGLVVGDIALQGRFDREGTRKIRAVLRASCYDVIFAWNPRALACGLRASKGMPVKVVAYRGVIGNISYWNPESWITFLHPRVDRIVCVANAIRDYLAGLSLFGMRLPPECLLTIYKGHDLDWYQDKPADLSGFGIPEGAFVICCTGRDVPRKGFDVLIDAFSALPSGTDAHLLLVGKVSENPVLRAQAGASPRAAQIHFTDFRTDAPALAAASQVFVLPSTEREGLPRAVIEAMAYGVTPVVTSVGGMPELVEDGVSGLVVPPKDPAALRDALQTLYCDRDYRQKLGQAARKRVGDVFNIRNTIEKTRSLCEGLLGKDRS